MKVSAIMSEPVLTCSPETWLAQAARLMRNADYGILPIIDSDGYVVGIITDRDICLAIAASNRSPRAIAVHEVMTQKVVTARADDDVQVALAAMKRARVRRLPVLDAAKHLKGMLSFEDVVVRGAEADGISADDVVTTLRTLYERRPMPVDEGLSPAVA